MRRGWVNSIYKTHIRGTHSNGGGGLMAERDFQSVDAVYSGVAGRSAAQRRDFGIWHKPHMHQVVLDILRQVEGDEDPAFTDRQITEQAHLTNPALLAAEAGSRKIRPEWS
jgi:hypothetical protein